MIRRGRARTGSARRGRAADLAEDIADMGDVVRGQKVRHRQGDDATADRFGHRQVRDDAGLLEERLLRQMRHEVAAGADAMPAKIGDHFGNAVGLHLGQQDRNELVSGALPRHALKRELGQQAAIQFVYPVPMFRD